MTYENLRFETLFSQVNTTIENHKEIDCISGDNFNVFRILKMETNEVKMHSALIGDLLNPNGSHGQGKVFLDLFISTCSSKKEQFDTSNCSTHVEYNMGSMNDDRSEGGRIDILIRDQTNKHIIIENKIHASDQENQLFRYYKKAKEVDLFYLTLEGGLPSESSCNGLKADEHFKCISYRQHIIEWLESCRKEVAVLPILRESLSQYINLIKYLTNQTTSHHMQNKLTSIIKENLEASFAVAGNLNNALDQLSKEFGQKVEEAFAHSEFQCNYEVDFNRNYTGIWFYKADWKYFKIGFQFHAKNRDLIYGFTIHGDAKKSPVAIPPALALAIANLPNNIKQENGWWAWRQYVEEPYGNWSKLAAWEAIQNGSMLHMIQHHVKTLSDLVANESIANLLASELIESN